MALTPALLIGPDRHGRSVALADGLVVAMAPPGAALLPCPAGEIAAGAVCAHGHRVLVLDRIDRDAFLGIAGTGAERERARRATERCMDIVE